MTWRVLTVLAVAAVAVWATLFVLFWLDATDCLRPLTAECNNQLLLWLKHLVSLRWVKGYQELIAALIALLAALIVGRPVYIQLREARRQSSAAAIPSFRDIADEIEAHLDVVEQLRPEILRIAGLLRAFDTESDEWLYAQWPDRVYEASESVDRFRREIQTAIDRGYSSDESLERRLLDSTVLLRDELRHLALLFRQSIHPDYEEGEGDVPNGLLMKARDHLGDAHNRWIRLSTAYVLAVRRRRSAAWSKIRFLEGDAIGK